MVRVPSGALQKLSSIVMGVAAVAACNQLLGNDNATLQMVDASAPVSTLDADSVPDVGPVPDAATVPDASTTCPCDQTGAYCNACPLEILADFSADGGFPRTPLEIAVNENYLFVRTDAAPYNIRRYRLPDAINVGLWDEQTLSREGHLDRIVAGRPGLRSTLFGVTVDPDSGTQLLTRIDDEAQNSDPYTVYNLPGTDLVAAPDGVLGQQGGSVRYISKPNDEPLVEVPDTAKVTFYTANETFGLVGIDENPTDTSTPSITVHRVRVPLAAPPNDGSETFTLTERFLVAAANEETLFCSATDTEIRQVAVMARGTIETTVFDNTDGMPLVNLVADGPLLLAGTKGERTIVYDSPQARRLGEPLDRLLLATSRNKSHFFALVGTTLYWARRAPLRPPPP